MSSSRQRLTSAIRKIANTDPAKRDSLNDGDSKGGKPGAAGVGSSSEAQGDRVCCDGSVGGANPGTGERDPDADGAGQDGLNSDDPADIDMGDGTLSGVTDCETGQPICFDGPGFIPPDGWGEPNEPPIDEQWQEGYYWATSLIPTRDITESNTPRQSAQLYCEYDSSGCDGVTTCVVENATNGVPDTYKCFYEIFFVAGNETRSVLISRYGCAGSDFNCSDEPPLLDNEWPSDGCVNLSIAGGKIVGSKYDPENDGSYSAPRDSIDLCSNGDQIGLAPSADGGWKTINSTTDNGYLYDSSGRQIAHIDGNEYSDPSV